MTDPPSENRAVGTRLKDLLLQKQALPVEPEKRVQTLESENRRLSAELDRERDNAHALARREAQRIEDAFARAIAALKAGRHLDALGLFQAVLLLDPDHPRARINLAVAWAALGHEDRAAAELRQVLKQDPGNETARKNLYILTRTDD